MRLLAQTIPGLALLLAACASNPATTQSFGDDDAGTQGSKGGPGSDTGDDASPGARSSEDGGAGASAEAGLADLRAACLAAGRSVCGKVQQCSPFLFQLREADMSTCATRYAVLCETQATAPGSQTTAAWVQACGSAMATASCNDVFDGVPPAACQGQPGKLAVGAACGESTQCASLDCRKASGSYCGTCATPAGSGESCASADCAPGLACMSDHVCRALAPAGSSCSATEHCQYPLVCKSGSCVVPDEAGASCTATDSTCDASKGLVCDADTKQCVSVSLVTAGGPCGVVSGAAYACGGGDLCKFASSTSSSGTCLASAADGASCSASAGPGCVSPAYCASGKCTLPDPTACK